MSFCRITGRSRGLPKPNYFPLLPPISPADAKRFCRITGKSYGLPTHHYIPVVLGFHSQSKSKKSKKCKITTKSTGLAPHHYTAGLILGEKKKHVVLKDYRYVFPILDGDGEQQVALRNLLKSKEPLEEEEGSKFVYTVAERRCSLVFPAQLEAAVRDGDVRDVMLSRDCDTVLLRLKKGKNVSVEFRDLGELNELYDGFGPREDIFKERQKIEVETKNKKRKRQEGLSYAKKIFEDKEKAAEEEELKIIKHVKLRSICEEKQEDQLLDWKRVGIKQEKSSRSIVSNSCEWTDIRKPLNNSFDWEDLKNNKNNSSTEYTTLVKALPISIKIDPQIINLEETLLGSYNTPVSEETGGFEAIAVVEPFFPLTTQPESSVQASIKNISSNYLQDTSDVYKKFAAAGTEALQILPRINEIPKLVENMKTGENVELHKVKGLKLDIESAQRFIAGQNVNTPSGDIFVPGQTLQTENGNTFVPGFTVHTPDGPLFIPGQIISIEEECGKLSPVFVAGQTLPTSRGEEFVQGQTIHTNEGSKFITGQTVLTKDGPKFVAGQVLDENKFIPGQVVMAEDGPQFIPGQTMTDELGQHIFIPGQSYQVNKNWEFLPGQSLKTEDGIEKFFPGQTVLTTNGLQFLPGQSVISETNEFQFVPGITVQSKNNDKFVTGMTLSTPRGTKFVEGQIMKTPDGNKFIPGTTKIDKNGFTFAIAKCLEEVNFLDPIPSGLPIDPKTASALSVAQTEIFGHIIQTETGFEFIPENIKRYSERKKLIPGQLVRGKDGHRFVPGIITDDGFVPGQIVNTETGEQFVPGQVIDTSSGPKFVPGQMVETRSGLKFVPGQTVNTANGPQFIPGQIVETKVGPTFIPGQIISTEDEGSRFVPGQVVNTPDGPRFVPGRVVESTEHGIIFVPGQIVQTEEGPRFVAPDLTDTPEGEQEFSVQGFEVTPEELKLLRPQYLQKNTSTTRYTDVSIDANMLRQLSDAGLSFGKNISVEIPNVDVDVDPKSVDFDHAIIIAEKLGFQGNAAIKMAQIVSTIATLADKMVHKKFQDIFKKGYQYQNGHSSLVNGNVETMKKSDSHKQEINFVDDNWVQDALKSTLITAVMVLMDKKLITNNNNIDDDDRINNNNKNHINAENKRDIVFSTISESLKDLLRYENVSFDDLVEEFLQILLVPLKRNSICKSAIIDILNTSGNKIDILKSTLVGNSLKDEVILDRISQVLEEENGNDIVSSAFRSISQNDSKLISQVLQKVSQEVMSTCMKTEKEAAEVVYKAIIQTVQEFSEVQLEELLNDKSSAVRELLLQAVGLARALGMFSTASSLLSVINDEKSTRALATDQFTLDILKRLTIMRKLAEEKPQLVNALRELSLNSERAKSNPCLRTLVRESAALMVVPEEVSLETSDDIPTSLLYTDNNLAMEDFIMRRSRKSSATFMILKQGLQAVVPREAARSVLTGQTAYTVLDEHGIQHFEPLHVFSALRLSKLAAHRFSMYCCPVVKVVEEDAYVENDFVSTYNGFNETLSSSIETATISDRCKTYECNGVDLSKSDQTLEYRSISRENTPSFRRISSLCQDNNNGKLENYVVVKDFTAEDPNVDFCVKVGDIVEAIEYVADNSKESKVDETFDIGHIEDLLDNSAAKHKLSVSSRRKYADSRAQVISHNSSRVHVRRADGKEGWLPMSILMQTVLSEDYSTSTSQRRPEDSHFRREAVIKELVETEEEFGRDLQMVVERYLKPLDNPNVPRAVRDNKEIIFSNLKQIADFHNTSFGRVLIEGVKYYADQPRMLGKTFLRLERDFDKHVAYCRDEPAAQEFLQTNEQVREYFEELSHKLGDDKSVSEHLKLPIQRINDYQLLLKELVKYSTRLGEDCDDLQKALELMLGIPHRANDNKFISSIEGYKGNIHKLGRLLTHEWFTVTDKEGKSKERYLFLFKARILICKVRRISDDRSVFVLKDIIRLPEVEVKDHPEDQRTFELHLKSSAAGQAQNYPILLSAHKDPVKSAWLTEIRQHGSDVLALAEHAADDLQLTDIAEIDKGVSIEQTNNMSRRYSSSRYSASSKLIEESSYSNLSKSRVSSEVSSSYKSNLNSSSRQGTTGGSVIESSSSYQKRSLSGGDSSLDTSKMRSAKLGLYNDESGKPKFHKTIEGCQVEPSRENLAMLHIIAGESATFECVMKSSDGPTKMIWLKDNKPMDDKLADRVKTTSDGKSFKLQIQNVSESDSGIYIARASNGDGQATCTAQLVVQELTAEERKARADANSPIFLVRLKDTEILENTYLRFMIKVKGDPNPELKFYKDGILIDSRNERVKIVSEKADSGFYEIIIPDVQKQDAGKYSCTAINRFGEATCEATVSVCDEKVIFAGLPEGLLEPGEEPKFIWTRDGMPFDPEERFKVLFKDSEDTLALVFQHVKPEDAGLYTCVAQTSTGNISCSAELTVQGTVNHLLREPLKPALQSESRTSEVSAGGSAMLDLQVKGYPKPDIKWTKDGEEIIAGGRIKYLWEDEESLSLVIKNVTAQDAGIYKIRAKNDLGEDNTQIELIVKSAPKITKRMSDFSVQTGETISMSVQIQGSPTPEVKWYKNNQLIEKSSRIKISKEANDTYTLIIEDARLEDSGSYSIVAKNEINETSQFWDLTVKNPPKITKKLGEPRLIEEGDSLTLYIEVESDSQPSVTWIKDEQVLHQDDRIKFTQDGNTYSLHFSSVIDTDTASYKVLVSNEDGKGSDKTEIQVRSAPLFKKKLDNVVANENDANIELVTKIDSFSKPEVQWYFGETRITESKKEYSTSEEGSCYKLVIKQAKPECAGKYTCKAKNEVGESNTSASLTVQHRPKLLKKLADQKVKEGDTLKLTVQVSAVPEPEIKWFKDGQEVSADARIKITRDSQRLENYDLTVTLLKGTDGGVYEVRAQNDLGYVSSKSKVIVLTKSEATIDDVDAEEKMIQEENVSQKQDAENGESEGRIKVEKHKVEVSKGSGGETITISVASTTEHEATLSGPDEKHTISKMKSTKVEVQEITSTDVGPQVEEIASYSYIIQEEENSTKSENGVLIEEFSENEDSKDKENKGKKDSNVQQISMNRGVSIVSISDDDTNGKGISRDLSADEMQSSEFADESNTVNNNIKIHNDLNTGKEEMTDKKGLYNETIIEERSIDESLKEPCVEEVDKADKRSAKASSGQITEEYCERKPSISSENKFAEDLSNLQSGEKQNAKIEESKLMESKDLSITEESQKVGEIQSDDLSRKNSLKDKNLSRQSSKIERFDSVESKTVSVKSISRESSMKGIITDDGEEDEDMKKLLERSQRQRSVLDEILDKQEKQDVNNVSDTEAIDNETSDILGKQDGDETLGKQGKQDVNKTSNKQEKEDHEISDIFDKKEEEDILSKQEKEDEDNNKTPDKQQKKYEKMSDVFGKTDEDEMLDKQGKKDEHETSDKQEKEDNEISDVFRKKDEDEILGKQGKQDEDKTKDKQEKDDIADGQKYDEEILSKQGKQDDNKISDNQENEEDEIADVFGKTNDDEILSKQRKQDENKNVDKQDKIDDLGNEASPVIISSTLEDRDIYETQSTMFEVRATGLPRPEAKWYKDGEPLKISKRVQFTTIGEVFQLTVTKALEADSGLYTLVLTNKLGEKSLEGFLNVEPVEELRKPKIIEPLGDVDVDEGKIGTFKAVVTGDPIPDAMWMLNNEAISEDENKYKTNVKSKLIEDGLKECTYTLEVCKSNPDDVGNYTLQVKNEYGEATSSADLNLRIVPIFEDFKDLTAPVGETVIWEATIKANPKPKVIWQCDGRNVTLDSRFTTEEDHKNKKYRLKIKDLEICDGGRYKIVASNEMGESSEEAQLKPYTEKPVFTKELSNYESVRDQNNFEAEIRVTGYPRPKISWLKDGVEIYEDMRNTITMNVDGPEVVSKWSIERFGEKDAGNYICQATNMAGTAKSACELTLTRFPPKFFRTLPPSLDLDQGEPLELFAKCDGSPIPTVAWYKDGEIIVPDDRVKIDVLPDGTMRLSIDRVKPTDSGAYKVVASNTGGDNPSQCAVAVKPESKKPYFKKGLEDVQALVGEPMKLEAQIVAFPNPQVQWFKDGLPLRPSKEIYFTNEPNGLIGLTIDKLRPEDAGIYSLVVSNELGEVTGISTVEVKETEKRPAFIATLHPTTVVEGFPAKLEVKVVGKPAPLLKWTHNGKEIVPDGEHIKIVEQPDGSQCLLIDKAGQNDVGEYEVYASNSKGEESCKARLEVAPKSRESEPEEKPQFLSPLHDVSVTEGKPLSLQALFSGNPIPEVIWSKDDKPLQTSEHIMMSCDGKKVGLEINPSNAKDSGLYTCELRSPLGTDKSSANATVRKVNQAPEFTQKFSDLQQMEGYDAKFLARVCGIPQPEISWFCNNKLIRPDNDKYKIKRDGEVCCLYVMDCTPADSGQYKCLATNSEGKTDCKASLDVVKELDKTQKIEPPSFIKRVGDCEVYKGMTAKFTACVTGYPEPDFEWYRDDTKLWPTDRILMENEGAGLLRLSIYHVDEDDAGKYTLRIFNPHGEAKSTGEMIFESIEPRKKRLVDQYADYDRYRKSGLPLPLADRPIISRMMDRHLTLSWKPSIPSSPRLPVTYQVEMCELPDGDWFSARSGIRGCVCDIRNLIPFRDYKFRVRVENKYGISDPSPFAQTYRAKLEPDPPKFYPYLPPGIDFRPETSPYFPKDFDIERPPHDKYAQAPRFLRQEFDTQYGVKNQNSKLFWFVYGYPKPKMNYYFNGELIEPGGRYDYTYTRNGQATLFINRMLDRDVGEYEAVATNEHGEARQRVRLEIAEYPTFITRPDETYTMVRKTVKIEARVIGVPYPELKWYKDWKPLASSTRIKIQFVEPDLSILIIEDVILKDEGLYSLSACNVAGCASSSAMLHVEECETDWRYKNYTIKAEVKPHHKLFGDDYDFGDELGRGTQGITYHAVERSTGRNFAAKIMHGSSDVRPLMLNEMDAMNNLSHRKLLRLHDVYDIDSSFTLIMELGSGGELVDTITRNPYYTEREIAGYIKQLLMGLDYMHKSGWAHLGLTLGDLLISHPGGDDLKIGDFGLSRRIIRNKLMTLLYGMPEYVPPEVPNGEGIDYGMDMWSTGIITYILLTGISPFRGVNDRETLTKIKEGKWTFDDERWTYISIEAKDFIRKLLEYQTERRMDADTALRHPWLNMSDREPTDVYKIPSEYLKDYYILYRDWYKNASCRTWYRRRRLTSAFEHPSKMVYPPGHRYTPERSPERHITPIKRPPPKAWENRIPSREPIDTEIGIFKNESHYQNGPDTYLLQVRDTDFPIRLRKYMKVAHNRGIGYPRMFTDETYDWGTPAIRERRRFTDVMDEEIDDERKNRINGYGTGDVSASRRLRHELGTRLDSYAEVEALLESKQPGQPPFFREKPRTQPMKEGETVQLSCLAIGNPRPIIQWFKNDCLVQQSSRVHLTEDDDGRSVLTLEPAREHDFGIYKIVARNKIGQTTARVRLIRATLPCAPDSPEVSDASCTELLLRWRQPKYNGNAPIVCYALQCRRADAVEWIDIARNIDHEFFLVHDLEPGISYNFRLAARNRLGWSEFGVPTRLMRTRSRQEDVPQLTVTRAMSLAQRLTESGREVLVEEPRTRPDYSGETAPPDWNCESRIAERYSFVSELYRGQFSLVAKGVERETERVVVAKIFELRPELEQRVEEEFEALRSLRHERIAQLEAAYRPAGSPVAVIIMEKLQGADVLTYLASRHEYTEDCVASVVSQLLDALQYLHWRGYCHLDIQPDNVVMASVREVQIKLVDMGSARRISKKGSTVPQLGHREYASPEVVNGELAFAQSDIWQVGVLAYVLLSGVSPFRGEDPNETRQNITFVRYRFEYLYKELTQEATRFLMMVFKRSPSKRPTAEECLEHRWLMPSEYMIKKRERSVFLGNRLKEYNEEYHAEKRKHASQGEALAEALGSSRQLARSNSIQDELLTTF